MVCYRAVDEVGVRPNLMSRFREEYYVPQAKKARAKVHRQAASGSNIDRARAAVRTKYFALPLRVREEIRKAQVAQRRLM